MSRWCCQTFFPRGDVWCKISYGSSIRVKILTQVRTSPIFPLRLNENTLTSIPKSVPYIASSTVDAGSSAGYASFSVSANGG